jgi:hypothetical protein
MTTKQSDGKAELPFGRNGLYIVEKGSHFDSIAMARSVESAKMIVDALNSESSRKELLEALKGMLRLHYDSGTPSLVGLEACQKAQQAIANAEKKGQSR